MCLVGSSDENNANGRERIELRNKRLDSGFFSRMEGQCMRGSSRLFETRKTLHSTTLIFLKGLSFKNYFMA